MNAYHHFTTNERETVFRGIIEKKSPAEIGKSLGKHRTTIVREIARHGGAEHYSPNAASIEAAINQSHSGRQRILRDVKFCQLIQDKIEQDQWSPQEISERLKLENSAWSISTVTIYRAINAGLLTQSNGEAMQKKLRHKGKKRHHRNSEEKRGKISISHHLYERPKAANQRLEFGHFELDTVLGKQREACAVTMVDRKTRLTLLGKAEGKKAVAVNQVINALIAKLPKGFIKTLTPDRGKEFANHAEITAETGIEFYFPQPHAPWQRGTNENTNGLIREYFPKYHTMQEIPESEFQKVQDKLNNRPRKCLGYLTPLEVALEEMGLWQRALTAEGSQDPWSAQARFLIAAF